MLFRSILPGGDLRSVVGNPVHPVQDINEFTAALRQRCPWVDPAVLKRWAHTYGSRTLVWLDGARRKLDLGAEVAPGLFERELNYLRQHEWAMTAEDVLWRRTKLGLHYSAEQRAAVADWMAAVQTRAQRSAA